MALTAGALTMSATAPALAVEASPGAVVRTGDGETAGNGGDVNPMCMLRPQDCMYPPQHRKGDGDRQAGPADGINPLCMLRPQDCMYPPGDRKDGDGGGMNPMCMFRPQDCWPPPGHDGNGDHDTRRSPGGGRTGG